MAHDGVSFPIAHRLYLIILLLIYSNTLPDTACNLEVGFVLFWGHHLMVIVRNICEVHRDTVDCAMIAYQCGSELRLTKMAHRERRCRSSQGVHSSRLEPVLGGAWMVAPRHQYQQSHHLPVDVYGPEHQVRIAHRRHRSWSPNRHYPAISHALCSEEESRWTQAQATMLQMNRSAVTQRAEQTCQLLKTTQIAGFRDQHSTLRNLNRGISH
jgi:hypothetical protein